MSVLEKIRSRAGLLVGIVGVALLVFILQSAFESGNFFFGNKDRLVGEISGKGIKYDQFNAKVQQAIDNQKKSSQSNTLDEAAIDGIVQQVWNQTINEEVLNKEYEKLGISVSDDELYDLMVDHPHSALVRQLSDPQSGKVVQRFADPVTGQVSPAKIKEFTTSMTDDEEAQWLQLENYVKQVRIIEKYNNLIKKGLYVTTSVAKRNYIAQNTNASVKYVMKNFKTIADSTIKPTDAELNDYYNAHLGEFKQEATRKVEYVAFDINPSEEDFQDASKQMQKVAEDFKTQKPSEDSTFVVAESDSRFYDLTYHAKGTLSPQIDTAMFKAEVGTVMGPYFENGTLLCAKLIGTKTSADSAKVRHILIAYKGSGASPTVTRSKDQAKKLADSLLAVVKKGGKFDDIVTKFSDDGGKNNPGKKPGEDYMGKGGNYGWINAKSGFVPAFKDAGLDNKKGDIVIAESNYGYHIIEVMDSKGQQKKVQVVTIDKKVEPSSKTMQGVFTQASQFAGKNNTNELFQKAATDGKLNKRVTDPIKESDKTISGLETPKTMIRWAYDNKKGTVSEPMDFGTKYIVAVLTDVREKGTATLEEVKDVVTEKVIKQKKGEMFSKEFTDAMAGGASIDAIASKMQLQATVAPNINFGTAALPGSTNEPGVIGAISAQKDKSLSKPLVGREGVFVVYVDASTAAAPQKDYKAEQSLEISQLAPRVDYEVYDALKQNANISEHIVKFY